MHFASERRLSVLLADDSTYVRDHLRAFLADFEWVEVAGEAADVPSTLALVSSLQPDVVLLDLHMPGGSGIQVLRQIRLQHPRTKAIMLTNHVEPLYRTTCMRMGARGFLDKSMEFEAVGDALRSVYDEAD